MPGQPAKWSLARAREPALRDHSAVRSPETRDIPVTGKLLKQTVRYD
jgi:hypothetical protein